MDKNWNHFCLNLHLSIFTLLDACFASLTGFPGETSPLIPVTLLIAVINAFNEDYTLRAAPFLDFGIELANNKALMITSLFFGLGHFYGVPNGLLGVLLVSFLGWFSGKSVLETKGFFWIWLIHFLPHVSIFTFFAISAFA